MTTDENTLESAHQLDGTEDIAQKDLPEALKHASFPEGLLFILQELERHGHQAFAVGGSIRDILLGRMPGDYDIATDAIAESQVVPLFANGAQSCRGWKSGVLLTGLKHGTVMVRVKPIKGRGEWFESEVTTFRGEGDYLDGRHPESIVFLRDVEGDLARRDFTVNAMAYDPVRGVFIDPFGGRGDLAKKTIRCVGRALDRFSEDGLRPLRAVRFAAVLGFDIEQETLDAIPPTLTTFDKVSCERQRDEFTKMLLSSAPNRGIQLLDVSGLISHLLPQFAAQEKAIQQGATLRLKKLVEDFPNASLELRLTALLGDLSPADLYGRPKNSELTKLLRRLRFSNGQIDLVQRLSSKRTLGQTTFESDASLRKALSSAGTDLVDDLLKLARSSGTPSQRVDDLSVRIHRVLAPHPPLATSDLALHGEDIRRVLDVPPGPAVGKAMNALLNAVLDDPDMNTPERLSLFLKENRSTFVAHS